MANDRQIIGVVSLREKGLAVVGYPNEVVTGEFAVPGASNVDVGGQEPAAQLIGMLAQHLDDEHLQQA